MKLVSFAVGDYRSITKTSRLSIRDSITTLIGPNNEGKSNVLRAMVTALEIASRFDEYTYRGGRLMRGIQGERLYRWETDYPIALQPSKPDGLSEFDIEFQLDAVEIAAFKSDVGSNLNGTLPVRIGIGATTTTFTVPKKGPGAAKLADKAAKIGRFIARRIDFQYIPAVRPASAATNVVESIVSRELQLLADDPEYQQAVKRIEELQAPVLKEISDAIRDTLKVFLPKVKRVYVDVPRDARYRALSRSVEVVVDDGSPTSLSRKGDGVQSLAALSLMRHASQTGAKGKAIILAIEEPESHLHPNAIHQLRTVLGEIAKLHQVIITTHCPLFVDRTDASANILVSANRANPATSIQQIRDVMGIRLADNLSAAEVMLLVEGEEDRRSLKALLSHHSATLGKALQSGHLGIDTLVGGGNLPYKLTQVRDAMCRTHALMDFDESGRTAVKKAVAQNLLELADLTYTTCPGMTNSELEDWFDPAFVASQISNEFGISASSPHFTSVKQKWSVRMADLFHTSGKGWDDVIEMQIKRRLSNGVVSNPSAALHSARRTSFDALLASLEAKLRP